MSATVRLSAARDRILKPPPPRLLWPAGGNPSYWLGGNLCSSCSSLWSSLRLHAVGGAVLNSVTSNFAMRKSSKVELTHRMVVASSADFSQRRRRYGCQVRCQV